MTFRRFTLARLLFATGCLCAAPAFADNLTGQASIIDGDTLEIHGTRIRLWGIDAPESNQLCRGDDSIQYRCGAKAANDLDSFLNKRPIDCGSVSLLQYRRTVAVCSIDLVEFLRSQIERAKRFAATLPNVEDCERFQVAADEYQRELDALSSADTTSADTSAPSDDAIAAKSQPDTAAPSDAIAASDDGEA